jgi:RimJ/RimL family protein N-acetyltransferase
MDILFDAQNDYLLEDTCVLLRPLKPEDDNYLLAFAMNEPDLWKYSLIPADGVQNMQNYIAAALNGRKEGKEYPFIVFDKRTQEYAGSTRFYDIQLANKVLQLGYTWYGKKFHGSGLNKHCKYLLLQFAFEQMGMERVEFRADNSNQRSIAAMKGIGCKVDGVLRSNMPKHDGTRRDSIVLSILKNEWADNVKINLANQLL